MHGCLDRFSAFPFENYLQILKKKVRSGKNPLKQIAKRISEIPKPEFTTKYSKVTDKRPNNAYILAGDECCEVRQLTSEKDASGNKLVMCRICASPDDLYDDPGDTRVIGAFKVNWRRLYMKMIPEKSLTRRAIMINRDPNSSISLASE